MWTNELEVHNCRHGKEKDTIGWLLFNHINK